MLKQLRQKKTMKRILWTLAILIIPPFVFWGAGSAMRSRQKGPNCAGTIFGRNVSFEEYSNAWQAARNQAMMMYGSKMDEIADALNLEQQAWDRLILLHEAKKKGLRVSDQEVINTIQNLPFFQSKGQFDKRAYDLILTQAFRVEPRQFEEEIREILLIEKLRDTVIKGVQINDEELTQAYKRENEKSRITYILVAPAGFRATIKIDEPSLKRYYQANAESFRVGEQVNVEYIGFEFADYKKDAKASEDSAKENALMAAEKIDYILADKTKSFEETAKENSLTIKETGFFGEEGPIPQIGWFPEIQKAAFRLRPGERSELIKSKMGFAKGYYIIKLKEKRASYVPGYEEVKSKIENILTSEEAQRLAAQEAGRLHKKLSGQKGLKFEDSAARLRRKVNYSQPFTRNEYIQGLGMAAELGEAAFTIKPGEISPVTQTRAGYCIFTVAQITPIDEEKFKNEKEEFSKKALESKKSRQLNDWYMGLLKRAALKNNLAEAKQGGGKKSGDKEQEESEPDLF